jgi:hypothetical protein
MTAPIGTSPVDFGLARLAKYERAYQSYKRDPDGGADELIRPTDGDLDFKGKFDFCLSFSCWNGMNSQRAEIEALLAENQILYERYIALFGEKGYFETASPNMFAPISYAPRDIHLLMLAKTALTLQTGSAKQLGIAIHQMRDDVHLHRIIFSGEGNLLSKMLAIGRLHIDYSFLADAIADPKFDFAGAEREGSTFSGMFELSDWRLEKVFAGEYRFIQAGLDQIPAQHDDLSYLIYDRGEKSSVWRRAFEEIALILYKINATKNLAAENAIQNSKMADAGPHNLKAARLLRDEWLERHYGFPEHLTSWAYNPFGKIMNSAGALSYDDYLARGYDMDAFQRLVRLGYEIRRQNVPQSFIADFMKQNPAWATHPVDGSPFVFDPTKHEITMTPLGTHPRGRRFTIPVWQAKAA